MRETEVPPTMLAPCTDPPRFRIWVTGKAPAGVQLHDPLYHDVPREARTYLGRPCHKKKCMPTDTFQNGSPASWYFAPSGICVTCWQRWEKTVTLEDGTPRAAHKKRSKVANYAKD
jgi:hypothetical protein